MALAVPAVSRQRLLLGALLLLVLAGPFLAWKTFWLLWPARWAIVATWLTVEVCFYWLWFRPTYARHCKIPVPCRPKGYTDADGRRLWRRFIAVTKALPDGIDAEEYLVQWFRGAPFESIQQENVEEMLTYGFFYKKRDELSPDMQLFAKQMVRDLEGALRMRFAPGYNDKLRFMSHLWEEELWATHRLLIMYAFFEGMYVVQRVIMACYGFQYRRLGEVGYYTLGCGLDAEEYNKKTQDSSSSSNSNNNSSSSSSSTRVLARRSTFDRCFDAMQRQLQPQSSFVHLGSSSGGGSGGGGSDGRPQAATQADPSPFEEDPSPFADPGAAVLDDIYPPAPPAPKNPLQEAVPQDANSSTPVMFLHGVGGLMLYLEMVKRVIGLGHPVIVMEYKHVGLRLSTHIPDVDELTRNVVAVLDLEGIRKVCVVGHSYGSFVASRLNMKYRERVHSMCVIDPVALGMFMPHLLHNFMYRKPCLNLRHPDLMLRQALLWFASRDVHLAATFCRNFYWTELNMWPEDLPPGSCVILSEDDDLCNAKGVEAMCKLAPQVKVIVNPDLFHGAFLLSGKHKTNLITEVRHLLDRSGSMVVHMARPVLAHTLSAAHSLLHGVETLTSRLSMSPQPFAMGSAGGQQQQQYLDRRPSSRGGMWQTMSGLAASMKRRGSVPATEDASTSHSSSSTSSLVATRSPSAPLNAATAAAAAAAAGVPLQGAARAGAGAPGSPGSTATAAAGQDGSSGTSPQLAPAAAGWWGPAAVAAAAACDQQPAAAVGQAGGRGQQQQQLSVILSGPEGTLVSQGELGGSASLVERPSIGSAPSGSSSSGNRGVEEDADGSWVLADASNSSLDSSSNSFGARPGSDQGMQFTLLGVIQEDSQELHMQQSGGGKAAGAAGGSAAVRKGAAAAAAAAPAGASSAADAAAQEDQAA